MTHARDLRWKVIPFLSGRPKSDEEGYDVRNNVISNDDIVNMKIAIAEFEKDGLWNNFLEKV